MSFEALKQSPIPLLFYNGYRIVRARKNKHKEVVIYLAKPENAIKYRKDKKIQMLCDERIKELQSEGRGIRRKIHRYHNKTTFCRRIKKILINLFSCFLCNKKS